jgi:hypothetical protein
MTTAPGASPATETPASPPPPAAAPPSTAIPLKGLASLLLWEIVPPVAAYYVMRSLGFDSYVALLGGAAAAGLRALYVLVRERKLDGFAMFLFAFFVVGSALALVTGDEKFLLAKMSLHTAFAALVFLGSLFARRPLAFYAARRVMAANKAVVAGMETRWESSAKFRRAFRLITLVWGVGMLAEAAIRVWLIYLLPTDVMVGVSNVLIIVTMVGLIGWSRWYRLRATRLAAH